MKCIACIAALTFSQVALAAEEAALVLDPSVQEKLAPLLRNYKPSKPIASSVEIREINNKGNFGTLTYYERQAVYARQESGLWAVLSTGRFTASGSAGSAQSVSLCGLVTLLSATAGKMVFDNSGVVPIGKHFVPFGIKSSVDTGRRLRVTAVEFDTPNICAPAPGAEFKYRIETEVQTKTSGLLQRTGVANHADDFSCKVASQPAAASEIHPSLTGEVLHTSCERTNKAGDKAKLEYVFLKDAGFYLPLKESGSVETQTVQYKDLAQAD